MSAAQDAVHEYLRERFDHIFIDPDDGEVAVPIGHPGGTIWLRAHIREGRELVAVSSSFPVRTPPYLLTVMSEYLQRCSEGLCIGGFRLDFQSGAVLLRTSQFYEGTTLEKEHVAHLVGANIATVRVVLPGMMAVAYGGMAPKDAVDLPGWPERVLDDDLERALEDILGADVEPESAMRPGAIASTADSAGTKAAGAEDDGAAA